MKRIAIITGASSGLGAAFAVEYVSRYAELQRCNEVWLIARNEPGLVLTGQRISALCGTAVPQIRHIPFDIGGTAGVRQLEKLLAQEGQAHPFTVVLLINNAGFGIYGPFAEISSAELLQMIDVNIYALTGFCTAVLPFMQAQSYIINVASMAAFLPVGNFSVYAATKSYVLSFSHSLRAELKHRKIGVTVVCPGQTATGFARRALHSDTASMPKGAKDPQKIAAHALRCTFNRQPIAVWGIGWKVQAFASRFIGKSFFSWFTFRFVKRIRQE